MPGHIICEDDYPGTGRRLTAALAAAASAAVLVPAAGAAITPSPRRIIERALPTPGHIIENLGTPYIFRAV